MEGYSVAFFCLLTIFNVYHVESQNVLPPDQSFFTGSLPPPPPQPPIDNRPGDGPSEICIGCICEGASNCNRTLQCGDGMCGLFRITKPYWIDAGKPILEGDNADDPQAWERCAIDPFCAGQAVLSYTGRFRKDCNADGRIDCRDFALVHFRGGYGCAGALDPVFEKRFNNCIGSIGVPV